MANALTSDAFQVCISLTNVASSRKMQATTNTTMNILYFGNQNDSTVGTLTNNFNKVPSRATSAGTIAGAVIGSILGCLLLTFVGFFIIFIVVWTKRSVQVKRQQSSFELIYSPASIPVDQNENAEQVFPISSDIPTVITESVLQDDNHKQVAVTEATSIQDTPIIEETKAETAVEEIMLDLSDNVIILEPVLQSTEATTTSDQENVLVEN
jgi:hypothetical protein